MSCPSSIRRRDSNPLPLDCEPPPITTRPGLPPQKCMALLSFAFASLPTTNIFLALIAAMNLHQNGKNSPNYL